MSTRITDAGGFSGKPTVLILSSDAVAAALLGALVETLGYPIQFQQLPESAVDTLRRVRASVALVDCIDAAVANDEFLGRAHMRGVSVIVFGSAEALRGARQLAAAHSLDELLMPANLQALDKALRRAAARSG